MSSTAHCDASGAERFGREALGPILAEFCQRLWLLQRFLPDPDDAVLLYCARGGLRMQFAYERFLLRTGLPERIPGKPLMVSRLVASRTALTPVGASVLDEFGREFAGRPMTEIAGALSQCGDLVLGGEWQMPFERMRFTRLLTGEDPGTVDLRERIAVQDARFRSHLAERLAGRRHAILVDTGLYGSTVRILREGIPELRWSSLLFARANYKQLATPHFAYTLGVSVESDVYKAWDVRSSALRFWHLIESALEPDLPSARTFDEPHRDETPRCNLEIADWPSRVAPGPAGLFGGAMAYLDDLRPADLRRIPDEAERGWRLFRRSVLWPDRRTVATLAMGDRSRDFGRTEQVTLFARPSTGSLALLRNSLWREGALANSYPRLSRLGLPLIEMGHAGRALSREVAPLWRRMRKVWNPLQA